MRAPVTQLSMLDQMRRLNTVFGKFDEGEELARAAAGYYESLRDIDLEAIAGAVGLALKTEQRFPYPAKLREYAAKWSTVNRVVVEAKRDPADERVCRYCSSRPRWAWLERRDPQTAAVEHVERCICPCIPEQHPVGTGYVPMPANFIAWAD